MIWNINSKEIEAVIAFYIVITYLTYDIWQKSYLTASAIIVISAICYK